MKDRTIALILTFFLGFVGIHHFYLNQNGRGVLYFIFSWTGIPLILSLFDFIGLCFTSNESFDRKYNAKFQIA